MAIRLYQFILLLLFLAVGCQKNDGPEIPETAVLYLGLCELYLEQGELEAARQQLQ